MTVEVRLVAHLIDVVGRKRFNFSFEGPMNVYELLNELDRIYGLGKFIYKEDKSITDEVRVMLGGRDIKFLEPDSRCLKDGDIILILPVLAGG